MRLVIILDMGNCCVYNTYEQYTESGHGGPGNTMTLSRKLFFVLQGLLGIAAGLTTMCATRHATPAMHTSFWTWSHQQINNRHFHDGAELLAPSIERHGVTSSTAEHIKEIPHDYNLSGHGGPGNAITQAGNYFWYCWLVAISVHFRVTVLAL